MLVGLAALGLLGWSGIGLIKELNRIPANRFFETREGRFQSAADGGRSLARAAVLYEEVPTWTQGPRERRRLGVIRLIETKRQRAAEDRAETGPASETMAGILASSLEMEPAHPLTWAYLSELELAGRSDSVKAFHYLKQSYRVAPIEPSFFFYRLGLALRCNQHWDVAFFRMLRREMMSIFAEPGWHPNRKGLVQLVRKQPRLRPFITRMLGKDETLLLRFEQALNKQP